MKRVLLSLSVILSLIGCGKRTAELNLLVGTYTDTESKGIYSFRFNQNTGDNSPLSVTEIPNPSFLAVTPDNKIVYSVTEQQVDAAVSAFAYNPADGTLKLLGKRPTYGSSPCHVTYVGKDVVATNYSSGSLTIFPLEGDGNLKDGSLIEFFEIGPDSLRQEGSHIHSSQVSPDGKFLFVIDLGGDYIYRYPVEDGKVTTSEPVKIKVPAGEGPRHFDYSKDGHFMYVITELEGNVLVYEYNDGDLSLKQTIEADPLHARGSADIHFSPDGKFLYGSNRLKGDGIAIFKQNSETGLLEYAGYQETGIHPRNFAVSPNGKFVIVACRDSDVIQVFSRDPKTGLLNNTGKDIKVPHPVCVILTPIISAI
ncbi:MAG: lactonase family protein [Bacteroidales bacterium]|nr:lactonase family protein [Bacteroidales bacterium]